MTNHDQIVRRFVEKAGLPDSDSLKGDDYIRIRHHSGYGSSVIDTVYSYGWHFPLARIMPLASGDPRGWWLLNGDTYSVSTTRHQNLVRAAVKDTGLPVMIVSFDALRQAGIRQNTITPVEILPDRYTWEPRISSLPPGELALSDDRFNRNWQQRLSDRKWTYEAHMHHLGEAVFRAEYTQRVPRVLENGEWRYPPDIHGTAYFLSAFDENEPGFGLYFLAQLPEGAEPTTVAEARECLKPGGVRVAEAQGHEVLRQGDVFAIPVPWSTRDFPGPSERSAYVLDVNHVVTEVRKRDGLTYGRGYMRHRPQESWRQPEHRRVKLGDGSTWYLLVRNTVPDGRSWSMGGDVD